MSRGAAAWHRSARGLMVALLVPLALAGCYESATDLIGANAASVTRFDALLPIGDKIYFARQVGVVTELCSARTRQELATACEAPTLLRIEPLASEEYLLQVGPASRDENGYGLLLRDRKDPQVHCVMWLGLGLFDKVEATTSSTAFLRDASFPRLRRALGGFPRQALRDRAELLRIAAVYRQFARGEDGAPVCFGEHIRFDPKLITLAQ